MPSAVIASYTYDEISGSLVIKYQSGLTYRYLDVPPEVYQQMKAFKAKGVFLNQQIKGKYEFERVVEGKE